MASITPSTVLNTSVGSMRGTLAKFVTTTVNAGDYWTSSITDIVAIFCNQTADGSTHTTTGMAVSYTASNGTIWLYPASQAVTATILVLSAGAY